MKKTLIVVAGGRGERMGSDLPKQFLPLAGRPILMHTMDLFHRYDSKMSIILGLPDRFRDYWEDLCSSTGFAIPHIITPGGRTRFHTVKEALECTHSRSLIAIHDSVRPLVSKDTIDSCFHQAGMTGAAIPCIDISESLREIRHDRSISVDRTSYRLVQTPQVYKHDILVKSYQQDYDGSFTDDASVVEKAGYQVSIVKGNEENIKITAPGDIAYAESILESFRKNSGLF
jgi:2-C-methyl-D-erythritol 4-phosphate cytidylyltransferase